MRIVVDLNRCEGYAQCAFLAPDVFTMHGEEALMYTPHAGDAQREHVMRAAAACPVQAILVDQRDDQADEPAAQREAEAHVR
ncbi:ferredoxin [Streptosporangium lutulentum]|uniref:Ferredoxin n=1 Tax=Streptosporangium lutulentum TaxID=1461250 RepID=A0ABT9QP78_9ACTN|nr:ferredoxin [Streptosporangium lutulentum]MDP9848564.1 ferredoxin [Streptosporangium lutulentum]